MDYYYHTFSLKLVPASFNERVATQKVLVGSKAIVVCDALGDNPIKIRWLLNHRFIERTPSRMKVGVIGFQSVKELNFQ